MSNSHALFKDKLCVTNPYPNPNSFQDLTPTSDCDEDKVYSNAIKWALENKKITNLAITGSYGSGKSSILRAFEKAHCEYKYLNISLASFKDGTVDEPSDDEAEEYQITTNKQKGTITKTGPKTTVQKTASLSEQENLIELSILQQIFYHVKAGQIPDSRFKRINSLKNPILIIKSVLFVIWLVAGMLFFNFPVDCVKVVWEHIEAMVPLTKVLEAYIPFCIFFVGAAYLASKLLRVLNNAKFNKLNVQNGEFEICKDDSQSILNKHIDEILYFFEVTEFNVVFVEDLDRFENTEIFTKLRELNILINRSKQVSRRVVFIYAIKDDMFKDDNRTKFFDFVIPVIPVVNISNSGAKFLDFFDFKKLDKDLDSRFIGDVSLYITDMRLLKNIHNEYVIFRDKIGSQLDPNKLLAVVIYKNIYPTDFTSLQDNRGFIFDVFTRKKNAVNTTIKEKGDNILQHKTTLGELKNEFLNEIDQLRSVYLYRFIERISDISAFALNGNRYDFNNAKNDAIFPIFVNGETIHYYTRNNNHQNSRVKFSDLEKKDKYTYKEREKMIEDQKNGKIEELQLQIENLENQIIDLKKQPLSKISSIIDRSKIYGEITGIPLVYYLLENGYLDENYHDYMSLFYDGFITKEEHYFLLSVKNRKALNFDYKLKNINNLIDRIWPYEWNNEEILNGDIIDYMLVSKNKFQIQIESIFTLLKNKSVSSISFIDYFINNGENVSVFLTTLCNYWSEFWEYIVQKTDYSCQKKDVYLKKLIEFLDEDQLLLQDKSKTLSSYITVKSDFIDAFSEVTYHGKIERAISLLNIKFEMLIYTGDSNWLTKFIYATDSYKLNRENISLFISLDEEYIEGANSKGLNYSNIKRTELRELKKYIEDQIEEFVNNTLLNSPNSIREEQNTFVELLNNEKISTASKMKLIIKYEYKVSSLSEINSKELYPAILENFKVKNSWVNIIQYYKMQNQILDKNLITYLNTEDHYKALSKHIISEDSNETSELFSKLTVQIIECEDITDDSLSYLLCSLSYKTISIDWNALSKKKVCALIKNEFY